MSRLCFFTCFWKSAAQVCVFRILAWTCFRKILWKGVNVISKFIWNSVEVMIQILLKKHGNAFINSKVRVRFYPTLTGGFHLIVIIVGALLLLNALIFIELWLSAWTIIFRMLSKKRLCVCVLHSLGPSRVISASFFSAIFFRRVFFPAIVFSTSSFFRECLFREFGEMTLGEKKLGEVTLC